MSGEPVEIAEEAKLMLFRSIQEIISNCIKHSQATKLTVTFNWQVKELEIYTNDNGCGFDYEYTRNDLNKGLGLRNLESRFSIINAKHEVKSGNYGTTYMIKLPLN
jgi:signal transduction histidine kinase